MKVGQKIQVKFLRDGKEELESATVIRTTTDMLPLPDGYIPVRFESDGARLLVHTSHVADMVSA